MENKKLLTRRLTQTKLLTNILLLFSFSYIVLCATNIWINGEHAARIESLHLTFTSSSDVSDEIVRPVVDEISLEQGYLTQLRTIFILCFFTVFLIWKYKSYSNIILFGVQERNFSPLGTIAWYFVPVLNFYRPYLVMREIALGSDPTINYQEGHWVYQWKALPVGYYVMAWWLLWWAYLFFSRSVQLLYDVEELRYTSVLNYVAQGLKDQRASFLAGIIATCALIYVVLKISNKQKECFANRIDTNAAPVIITPRLR